MSHTSDLHAIIEHAEETRVLMIRADRVKDSITKRKQRYMEYYESKNPDPVRLKHLSNSYEDAMRLGWRIYHACKRLTDVSSARIDREDNLKMIRQYLDFEEYGIR